jgi:hypothetical protein
MYSDEEWNQIVHLTLTKVAVSHRKLKQKNQYLATCFHLLRPGITRYMGETEKLFYFDEVLKVANSLQTDYTLHTPLSPAIETEILLDDLEGYSISSGTTIQLKCNVHSHLPKDLELDSFYIKLVSFTDGAEIVLALNRVVIPANKVTQFVFKQEVRSSHLET